MSFDGTIEHWHFGNILQILFIQKKREYDVSVKAGNPYLPFPCHMA
ncbi:hypothetical protein CES85_2549 [Ochrobactrum quorumnocens]|uniref:Uncharacterized protein n=2 Tax=Brucella/Ochrobactrum group TaxID=2826938 RepID=A0A256F3R5_9HYPH|nr:hypothetical protein CES85_2549 [[Ochrobactrum] quorumnocens]OYR09423.1 hypothetical protein CEV32_1852 [Brucella rhizosphaerae]